MSTVLSEIRLRIRAEGEKVLVDLGAKLNDIANKATLSSNNFKGLAAELKQLQQTTVQSTRNIKDYSASWRELAASVDISSKEFKQATAEANALDARLKTFQGVQTTVADNFRNIASAAKQASAAMQTATGLIRDPLTGGYRGTAGKTQYDAPIGPVAPPDTSGRYAQQQREADAQSRRDARRRETMQQRAAYFGDISGGRDPRTGAIIAGGMGPFQGVGTQYARPIGPELPPPSRRRLNLGGAAQTAGAVAASSIFGGPEGLVGAGIGALGGPGGAAAGGAIGAQVGMLRQAIGETATYASEITKLNIALRGITKTSEEYSDAQNAINSISKSLNVPIKEATSGFTRLSASVIGAGGNVNDAEIIFKGITTAIKGTGGGAAEVQGALLALSQVFSKGKVTAEELSGQLGERLPGAVTAFAKATGRTLPQLQKDLENGVVGLNDVFKFTIALENQYGETAKKVASSSEESGARMTVAFDKLKFAVGLAFQPIGSIFQDSITEMVSATTSNLEVLKKAISDLSKFIQDLIGPQALKDIKDFVNTNLKIIEDLKDGFKSLPLQIAAGIDPLARTLVLLLKIAEVAKIIKAEPQALGDGRYAAPGQQQKTPEAATDLSRKLEGEKEKAIADIKQKALIQLRELAERTEEQVADIREAAIKRSIELERNFADQRLKTEREIQDLRNRSNELDKNVEFDKRREELRSLGLGTEGVDAAEKISNIAQDAQKERLQLQRNAEDNKSQRERQLEQFKTTNAEQIGKIQLTYTRSAANILQNVGDALKEKMITGAEEVKRIILEVRTGQQAPAIPVLPGPSQPGPGGPIRKVKDYAGEGMIITPAMTRPRGQSDFRGQSDVMTHYTEKVPIGQGMITQKQFRGQMGPPEKAAKKLEQSQSTVKEIADSNVLKDVIDKLREARQEALKPLNDQKKSLTDQISTQQRLYDLISSGLNPALADQVLSIEKAAENQDKVLISVRDQAIIQSENTKNSEKDRAAFLNLSKKATGDLAIQASTTQAVKEQAIALEKAAEATTRLVNEKQRMKDLVQGINSSIESGMVSAIDSAITGAKSLQEVMSNVLKDIGQMLISFGVKSLLNSLAGPSSSILSGGGLSAGTSTAFGGGIPGLDMAQFGGIKMFAAGGNPPIGRPSLVGEKGPELFVPRASGTIVPADATAAAMARYQRQGGSSGGNSSSDAMGADAAATPVLSMSFETTRFLGQDYVSTEQLQAAMMATEKRAATAGAKAGAAQVSSQMRNSPAYRRQVGLR
jgi:tape measure domain-containing protein